MKVSKPGPIAVLFALAVLAGCRAGPPPVYGLGPLPEVVGAAPIEVFVVDERPDWERRYYDGGAISIVTAEQLTPSPWEHLQRELRRRARELPDPPVQVEIVVRSFRVMTDDGRRRSIREQERLDAELARHRRTCELRHSTHGPDQDERPEDFDDALADAAAEGAVRVAASIGYTVVRSAIDGYGHPVPPDNAERITLLPGTTCSADVRVTLYWPDGRVHVFDLESVRNSEVYAGGQLWVATSQISPMVLMVVRDLANRIVEEASSGAPSAGVSFGSGLDG